MFGTELEVWVAATIGAAVCGYLIGDLRGSMRRLATADLISQQMERPFTLVLPEKVRHDHVRTISIEEDKPASSAESYDEPIDSNRGEVARDFVDNRALEGLRSQVRHMLKAERLIGETETLGCLPDEVSGQESSSLGLIDRYRRSLEEKQAIQAQQRFLFAPISSDCLVSENSAEPVSHISLQLRDSA